MRNTFAGVSRCLGAADLVSRAARLLLAAAMLVCSLDAAAMRLIEPGEDPKLAPGEGLVVLSLEVSAPVSAVRIEKVGGGTAKVISALRYGRNVRLYAAKAGEYRWTEVDVFTWYTRARFTLRSDEYRFKVVPGKIIYPGDLILRPSSWSYTSIHVANHSLPVIDWLETQHAALYKQLPFEYQGLYPDPFPAYYRTARAANTQAPDQLNGGREPPKPGTLPLPVDLLWKPNRVVAVGLNPAGDLLAETVRDGDKWAIYLIDLKSGTSQRLGSSSSPAYLLMWKDDHTLIAAPGSGRQEHVVYRIGDSDGSRHKVERLPIEGTGRVVDLMPSAPDMILFEGFDSRGKLTVHLVALSGKKTISGFANARSRDRLNVGVENDLAWLADGHGRLRAAMASRDETLVLMHGKNGVYNEVWRSKAEGGFEPAGLSFDGETIYGFTDDERSQRDLIAFDPATRKVTRTLFSKPGVDVVGMVFDNRREPVAARYYESGRMVTEYFDSASQKTERQLQAAFPGRAVRMIDRSGDGEQMILWVDASDRPPQMYRYDGTHKRAELLEDIAPWLSDKTFAPAHVITAKGGDGLPIEAFLTLPAGTGKRPLVVYPHGGPEGVRDDTHFNRDVQFLASQGYAVLQVNFRGSEGYGKAFRDAARGNFGRMIEDDIDAALRAALAAFPLDDRRMCMMGASYGGYSALVSAMRWPGRYRCAVSMSGVSDRVLLFTSSDFMRDADSRKVQERRMGNPNTDMEQMQALSPLYHTRQLDLPLMLVHGREDVRVDFEHTRRLVRMLNLEGRPPVVLAFPDMGHGFDDPVALDIAWTGIAGFLKANLGEQPAPAAGTASVPPATTISPAAPSAVHGEGK